MPPNDQGITKAQTPMSKRRSCPSSFGFGPSLVIGHWSLVILLGLGPSEARAHPVPRSEYDRNVTVEWRRRAGPGPHPAPGQEVTPLSLFFPSPPPFPPR